MRGLAGTAAFRVVGGVQPAGTGGGVDLVQVDAAGGGGCFCCWVGSTDTVVLASAVAAGLTAASSCCLALWAAVRALYCSRCAGPFCLCLGWC